MLASRSVRRRPGRRIALAVGALCLVPMGLVSRFPLDGWLADAAGGVLYAALVYLLVALVRRDRNVLATAAVAWAVCCVIELLQLTQVPGELAALFPPAALVRGTTFVATDLLAYALGAGLAALLDRLLTPGRPADAAR